MSRGNPSTQGAELGHRGHQHPGSRLPLCRARLQGGNAGSACGYARHGAPRSPASPQGAPKGISYRAIWDDQLNCRASCAGAAEIRTPRSRRIEETAVHPRLIVRLVRDLTRTAAQAQRELPIGQRYSDGIQMVVSNQAPGGGLRSAWFPAKEDGRPRPARRASGN